MAAREEIREGVFYILQDVRLGNSTEYEATVKLKELGVVIKGEDEEILRGVFVPTFEPLV